MLDTFCLHSNPFISLQFTEYIVTGDSVYYSGSMPLVEVVICINTVGSPKVHRWHFVPLASRDCTHYFLFSLCSEY
jgi:hypothetical protein